jgi:nicotinate-nucleotide pyrophosphorylase (carboxylating)
MISATSIWKPLLLRGLEDDSWQWDWTTLGTLPDPSKKVRARIIAKSKGIWAAAGLLDATVEVARHEISDSSFSYRSRWKDGKAFSSGDTVCEWAGSARSVLALERPFLNLAAYASGMATSMHELVALVRKARPGNPPRVTATRKILPGYRDLAIHAIRVGGGHSHRADLSGGVLIKENHIKAAGGIRRAVESARAVAPHTLKIEVEVRDLAELKQAVEARADVIMLDNFEPRQVRAAIETLKKVIPRPLIEVSGGIDSGNIGSYALAGVDIVSTGSVTHSVRSADFSLLLS